MNKLLKVKKITIESYNELVALGYKVVVAEPPKPKYKPSTKTVKQDREK